MAKVQSEDEASIRAVLDRLFESYRAKDINTMMTCYADDVVTLMPPRDPPLYGLNEWRQSITRTFERIDIVSLDIDIEEILVFGDWAWEWHNEWSTIKRLNSGEVITGYIRGAQLFRRESDGQWKVARFIANIVPVEGDLAGHKERIRARSRQSSEIVTETQAPS